MANQKKNMEQKLKHLEFIQNIITRMNKNSFQIKSLTITIVAALMAVYASTKEISFICISIAPTLIFWFLDSYYLQQERKFRGVYNDVAGIKNVHEVKPFEMPIQKYKGDNYCFFNVFTSKTIIWFYLSIIILLLITGIVLSLKDCCIIIKCL